MGRLISLGKAAALLGIHANTMRTWENEGRIKAVRVGPRRDRRFDEEEVLALMERKDEKEMASDNAK